LKYEKGKTSQSTDADESNQIEDKVEEPNAFLKVLA